MVKKYFKKFLFFLVVAGLLAFSLPFASAAFNFTGIVYNATGSALNGTNVTINIYVQPSISANTTISTLTNTSGHFVLEVNNSFSNSTFSFKPVLRKFAANNIDITHVGQILPDFPYSEFSTLSSVSFYLKEGVIINVSAFNETGSVMTFNYMVKDAKLGYPIESSFDANSLATNFTVYVPIDRNYTIMIYPQNSFPVGYDLTSFAENNTYQTSANNNPWHVDLRFNTSNVLRRVSGNVTLNGSAAFQEFNIIAYLLESASIAYQDNPLPYNISAWVGETDVYNNGTGFYNITLPGAVMGARILLFATVRKNDIYYGAFRNITLNNSNIEITPFHFDLKELLGRPTNITVTSAAGGNVTVGSKKLTFQMLSNGTALSNAHTEVRITYSTVCTNCSNFTWMDDLSASSGGNLTFFLLNSSIKEMDIYPPTVAPKRTIFSAAELASDPVTINFTAFNPGEIDSAEALAESAMEIGMYQSSATCSVPYPEDSCSLLNGTQLDQFNPLTVILGGGKLDFMIRMRSNNLTVKYIDVDLIASGPPDALFDSSANSTGSGADLDAAWRFGSAGPEIYSRVLLGIPYASSIDESAPFRILLNNLYDEDWNSIWNATSNANGENYNTVASGDYASFNRSWFNSSERGMACSLTNASADCYVNTTFNMIWLKIPHFSGIGPTVNTITKGNVTMNATLASYNCTNNCTILFNVSNGNYTLYESLQNITINTSYSMANIANISIYWYNQSDFLLNGTNSSVHLQYNFTLNNGSSSTVHQYKLVINKTNVTTSQFNISYNISGALEVLTLALNLTCVESWSCGAWGTCVDNVQYRTCTESIGCGTITDRPELSQGCSVSSTSSSGGGSSTGSTGGISTGIEGSFEQKTWTSINSGEAATVSISNGEIGVTAVSFVVDKTVWGAWTKVEKKESLPSTVKSFSQKVYKNIEITKSSTLKEDLIKNAKIDFKVKKTWLSENNVAKEQVAMFRYANSKWDELKTTMGKDDGTHIHYTAETPGFSYFLIGQKVVVAAPATIAEPAKEAATPTPAATPKEVAPEEAPVVKESLIWPWAALVIIVIAIIAGAMYWKKSSKKK